MTEVPIVIELAKEYADQIKVDLDDGEFTIIDNNSLTGVEIVPVLVGLTTVTIGAVTKIVVEAIRAKQHIVVKCEGVEVRGLEPNLAHAVIRDLLEGEAQTHSTESNDRA